MPENTNKVIQLKDSEGNDVSPVVNVGSIYDKNGQKVDNLLSYTVAGTDVPVPEIPSMKDEIKSELNGTIDAATLGGNTKEQIIASVPAPDLSNVNAAKLNGYTKDQIVSEAKTNVNATQLEGHPASYFATTASVAAAGGYVVGTYTGTATKNKPGTQTIQLEFTPSAVIVIKNDGETANGTRTCGGLALKDHPTTNGGSNSIEIVANGFVVSSYNGNYDATNEYSSQYYYIAFK